MIGARTAPDAQLIRCQALNANGVGTFACIFIQTVFAVDLHPVALVQDIGVIAFAAIGLIPALATNQHIIAIPAIKGVIAATPVQCIVISGPCLIIGVKADKSIIATGAGYRHPVAQAADGPIAILNGIEKIVHVKPGGAKDRKIFQILCRQFDHRAGIYFCYGAVTGNGILGCPTVNCQPEYFMPVFKLGDGKAVCANGHIQTTTATAIEMDIFGCGIQVQGLDIAV